MPPGVRKGDHGDLLAPVRGPAEVSREPLTTVSGENAVLLNKFFDYYTSISLFCNLEGVLGGQVEFEEWARSCNGT